MDCDAERKQRLQREQNSIIELMSSALSRAFLEWVLMFLLYINALFSFWVTQFARLCKLQTPCLLCSRLDHILLRSPAHELDFYNDLICHSHKKKISNLKHDSTLKHCSCCSAPYDNDDGKRIIVKKTLESSDSDHHHGNAYHLSDKVAEKHEERSLDVCIKPEPVPLVLPAADAIVDSTLDLETVFKGNLESMDDKLPRQTTRDVGSNMDLNDAYKLAIGSKSSSAPSPTVTQVITGRDSSKVYEDLRLLVSQFSAARGIESQWAELSPSPSPRVLHDPSNKAILEHITKSISIDRNESGLESLNHSTSIVSEIEGESVVDRLKRQIELDRKSIYLLYKELEEERNASAVAACQAMAMITRLQEEKASMHMEALQYQRMMEEQSEYDQEAVLKYNQVVLQREKEMQDLEAQLAYFRKKVGNDFVLDKFEESDV